MGKPLVWAWKNYVHIWMQVLYYNPKQLFNDVSITKITTVYILQEKFGPTFALVLKENL